MGGTTPAPDGRAQSWTRIDIFEGLGSRVRHPHRPTRQGYEGPAGAGQQREFTVAAADDQGELVAGLSGWTAGTSAGIAMVRVREDARHIGWGSRLLEGAERVARDRGCERANVSSFTFQAPAFYAEDGYVETERTKALPLLGQANVHFVKHLR